MRQRKRKPLSRKPSDTGEGPRRRNAWEPQVIVPHSVDLPLEDPKTDEVAVPAAPNGRSLINGRL